MSHIIEVKLRFKKKLHPNFFVRMFSFKYAKIKTGFIFNYRAFLGAYGVSDMDLSKMDELPAEDKISYIVYGAALEYCREHRKTIFFDRIDIKDALLMASQKVNNDIVKAMSYARMPEWLEAVMENMPQAKEQAIKKK